MRGLPRIVNFTHRLLRITPACAGTTNYVLVQQFEFGDHPRLCGDYIFDQLKNSDKQGSPPPVRGLLCQCFRPCLGVGITPACAGTTLKRSRNYLIFIIKYPIIYSLYELIFLPELHLQELCEELLHQCYRISKQFPACSYSKINYLFLQTA